MNLIDVTLRDGGHCVDFEWPLRLARNYVNLVDESRRFSYIELGYWKQSGKFAGRFYSVDQELLDQLPIPKNVEFAIMSDFHYLEVAPDDFPDVSDSPVKLLRLTSRKEDVPRALDFLAAVREKKGLRVSLNLFNISNYSHGEVLAALEQVNSYLPDFVFFADTHGSLDIARELERFASYSEALERVGVPVGLHLHNHSGLAMANFLALEAIGVAHTDVSLAGLGKGAGNLRLEDVVESELLPVFVDFLKSNDELFRLPPNPYFSITGRLSVTDHYAEQAREFDIPSSEFMHFLGGLTVHQADNFDKVALLDFLSQLSD